MKFDSLPLMINAIVMKPFKSMSIIITLMSFFTSCSSAQKLKDKAPVSHDQVYSQEWVSGLKEVGSGINLFIPFAKEMPEHIQLDSVYFRGKSVQLEKIAGENTLYVGRFTTEFNQKQDIVMSNDPNEEYGNQAPILKKKFPFDLKDSECVVSYQDGSKTHYFKIENIIEKQPQYYPSAPIRQ